MAISNSWKNLRSFLREAYNREVNEWFSDITDPMPDNSGSRNQAKRACLILPKDSQNMALIKVLNFRYVVQRTHLRPNIYGIPTGTLDAQRKYRPQVVLEFAEDELSVDPDFRRLDGRISFRLMNEDSQSITKSELTALGNKIKNEFGLGNGYVWKKGRDMASYIEREKGYQLQLLVRSKSEAKTLVGKVLSIQNHTPDWTKFNYKETDDAATAYPTNPGIQTIMGKTYKKPRKRPLADVRYQWASCSIHGLPEPVILHDRGFTHYNALVY